MTHQSSLKIVSSPTSMGSYVTNLVLGVLNGIELEFVHILLYLVPFLQYLRLESNINILDFSL